MTITNFNIYDMIACIITIILLSACFIYLIYINHKDRQKEQEQETSKIDTIQLINENMNQLYALIYEYVQYSKPKLDDGGDNKKW